MISRINSFDDYEKFLYGDHEFNQYCPKVSDQIWIRNVEKALGFRLFRWQKMMISGMTTEYGRRTGKSTTWALQKLNSINPIDMTQDAMRTRNRRTICNYKLLEEIAEKLDECKVPHAPIFKNKSELNEYRRKLIALGRGNGKHYDTFILDECILPDDV